MLSFGRYHVCAVFNGKDKKRMHSSSLKFLLRARLRFCTSTSPKNLRSLSLEGNSYGTGFVDAFTAKSDVYFSDTKADIYKAMVYYK